MDWERGKRKLTSWVSATTQVLSLQKRMDTWHPHLERPASDSLLPGYTLLGNTVSNSDSWYQSKLNIGLDPKLPNAHNTRQVYLVLFLSLKYQCDVPLRGWKKTIPGEAGINWSRRRERWGRRRCQLPEQRFCPGPCCPQIQAEFSNLRASLFASEDF